MLIRLRHFPTSTRKIRDVAIEYDAVVKMSGKFLGRGGVILTPISILMKEYLENGCDFYP